MNNVRLVRNSVEQRLFQAFPAVSGRCSAEEDCTATNAYWEKNLLLRMELLLDGFLAVSFVLVFG